MQTAGDPDIGTTIVSIEEQWRGWLSVIARHRDVHRQVPAYQELMELLEFFELWTILPFQASAADQFQQLRAAGVRIAAMDLKFASIALVNDSLLVTANERHFSKVPGLRFENWLR